MPPAKMRGDGRKAKDPKKTLLRLLSYLKAYTPRLIIVMLCVFATAIASITGSTALGNLVDDFIMSFPDQYDHKIEQGGTNVSGGQKQRLCIARALLKNPKILILDDSTSAVDTATDASIRKAFREEIPGTTKLIIAQRITSVQESDIIILMDNGQIGAVGNHESLMETSTVYQEIYYSQQKGGLE